MKIVWKDRLLEKEKIVNWISDWFEENGNRDTKAIIGLSGGKDSTVLAALCLEALGHDRVIAVLMPNGDQPDFKDSVSILNLLDLHYETVNIGEACKAIYSSLSNINSDIIINTPPRVRMTVLYAIAAKYGNARVICTDNASESYIGYSTKYGDLAGDVAPLANIPASLVVDLGRAFAEKVPDLLQFVEKAPSDGLCGKTDEDALGFTYEQLDNWLFNNNNNNTQIDEDAKQNIIQRHIRNLHKECICIPRYEAVLREEVDLDNGVITVET